MSDVTPIVLDPEPVVDGALTQQLIENFNQLHPERQRLADRYITAFLACRGDDLALKLLDRAEREVAAARAQGADVVGIITALTEDLERRVYQHYCVRIRTTATMSR